MAQTSHAKELVRRRTGLDVPELLRTLYVDQGHSQEEIAEAIGVHRITVGIWLREYGLTRPGRPPIELPA